MELNKYKLGECLELQRGYDLTSSQMQGGKVAVVGSNGIIGYHNSERGNSPCITVGRSGSVGKVHYYEQPTWAHNTTLFLKDFKGNNPKYLYYLLKNLHLDNTFEKGSSVIPSLDRNLVHSLVVPFHKDINDQRKIVTVLSAIDRKIELNRQINDNLEAMAKQLYDYWFVQFDFPNEEGKPYKSSGGAMVWNEKLKREIPTSFDVKSLSEIIEVKDGTHDSPKPQDNGYFLLTSKHLTERGLDYASAYKISKEDYESINKRSKVDTNDILFSMIGTIGNSYFVEETKINFAIKNMALFKTSAKRWFSEYMYLYLSSCDYKHYEGNSLSGSIQKFVSLRTLRDMPILYHEDIIKVFAKEVRNIITMMVNLRKENIELTKQRDELLPLLMNGQASVNSD